MTERDLLGGIDDDDILDNKEAYQIAHETCQTILDSNGVNEEPMFITLEFIGVLSSRAKGYSYKKTSEQQ
jgi:hypothetical protein